MPPRRSATPQKELAQFAAGYRHISTQADLREGEKVLKQHGGGEIDIAPNRTHEERQNKSSKKIHFSSSCNKPLSQKEKVLRTLRWHSFSFSPTDPRYLHDAPPPQARGVARHNRVVERGIEQLGARVVDVQVLADLDVYRGIAEGAGSRQDEGTG